MTGRPRQRPGAKRTGGQPARRAENSGKPPSGERGSGEPGSGEPPRRRGLGALNPRKPPTRSRVRTAALLFAALAIVLGVLGLTVNTGYLQPAVLLAILALLWGVRALTMR